MLVTSKKEIIDYINTLKDYEGYVQFSHRAINKEDDIFYEGKNVKVDDEEGFIYEAHFCNAKESISIKQINATWLVSKTNIENISEGDIQKYVSEIEDFNYDVKMAQIWSEVEDAQCEGMKVKKLQKVVFAGFENE